MEQPQDSRQTHTTWGANENFAQDFARQYELAQAYFRVYRRNPSVIIDLFDCIHQVYVMEEPYLDGYGEEGKNQYTEMFALDEELSIAIKNCSRNDNFFRVNRMRIYDMLDFFFRKLNQIAVAKKFFPMAHRVRTIEDKTKDLRLQ